MNYDFVAIDFETANRNLSSACSIGLAAVKNDEIIKTEYFLIQPPELKFDTININIHGITPEDVKDAPLFPGVWEQIKHYFDGNLIVAHNASFDMSVLKCCLMEYGLEFPNFTYLCSMQMSECICYSENISRSLKDRCKYFGIEIENHHNSLCDTISCAKLVISIINEIKRGNLRTSNESCNVISFYRFLNLKPQKSLSKNKSKYPQRIAISEIAITNDNIDPSHIFYDRNIVFTGEFETMSRRDAMQKVVNLGGKIQNTVSKKTNFLVVGIQDKSIVGDDGMSFKEETAHALQELGYDIKIINESEFLKLL